LHFEAGEGGNPIGRGAGFIDRRASNLRLLTVGERKGGDKFEKQPSARQEDGSIRPYVGFEDLDFIHIMFFREGGFLWFDKKATKLRPTAIKATRAPHFPSRGGEPRVEAEITYGEGVSKGMSGGFKKKKRGTQAGEVSL